MSDREKFEAWFDKEYPISGDCGRIKYRESSVRELMIAAWQASRREALEEAANACLVATPDAAMRKALGDAAHYVACSKAVRALAEVDRAKQPTRD